MIKYFIFIIILIIWTFSFYLHFIINPHQKLMIALVGKEHTRKFQHMFDKYDSDLWVFGRHKKRNTRLRFRYNGQIFDTFREYKYEHMLVVYKNKPIDLILSSSSVIEYRDRNETTAILWPRLKHWPTSDDEAMSTWRAHGGHVITFSDS